MDEYDNQVKNDYFEWLYNCVCKGRSNPNISYRKMFMVLHSIEFIFSIQNDIERARDGVDLRYRYAISMNDRKIMDILDGPCSVLEMMVALAIRCEETIMDDARYGDRTGQWFWSMLSNLGLSYMTDERFDREYAMERIYIFLDRRYNPNGKGGLFYISDCEYDLRKEEIWTQLCWYLHKINY